MFTSCLDGRKLDGWTDLPRLRKVRRAPAKPHKNIIWRSLPRGMAYDVLQHMSQLSGISGITQLESQPYDGERHKRFLPSKGAKRRKYYATINASQGTNQPSGLNNDELIMLWFCISCSLENISLTSLVANTKCHPAMALVSSTLLT